MIDVLIEIKDTPVKSVVYQGKTDRQLNGCVVFTQSKYQGFSSRVNPLGRHPFNIVTEEIYD